MLPRAETMDVVSHSFPSNRTTHMTDQPESSRPAEAVHPLIAIDLQQDEILNDLDALNLRIEAALVEFGRLQEDRRAA